MDVVAEVLDLGAINTWLTDAHVDVTGPLTGPSGGTVEAFISGWELRDGSCAPRNVTVLLGRRQRR